MKNTCQLFLIIMVVGRLYGNLQVSWHLQDSMIGVTIDDQKAMSLLAWKFSTWQLASKKGAGCYLAIIDSDLAANQFSANIFCKNCKNSMSDNRFYSIDKMYYDYQKKCFCEECKKNIFSYVLKNMQKSHGVFSTSLIRQIAPLVTIQLYNIFDQQGFSNEIKLQDCLKNIVLDSDIDMLYIGSKITSKKISVKSRQAIDALLSNISYVVAPSGNDALSDNQESYPARSKFVTFDVGSYAYHKNISSFSQFECNIGPKIVAPGENILFPVILDQQHIGDICLNGTSMSAAIVSGLVSLVIAEFKYDFSVDQIVSIIYQHTQKLSDTKDWQNKVLLGALDIRSTLFCLHVLREIKAIISNQKCTILFDQLIKEFDLLNSLPTKYNDIIAVHTFIQEYCKQETVKACASFVAWIIVAAFHKNCTMLATKHVFDKKLLYLLRTMRDNTVELKKNIIKK